MLKRLSRHKKHLPKRVLLIAALLAIYMLAVAIAVVPALLQANRLQSQARQADEALTVLLAAKEAKRKEPVYVNLPGAEPVWAIVEDYTRPDSLWTVINKDRSIPTSYIPSDLKIPNVEERQDKSTQERSVRAVIIPHLEAMFADAKAEGHNLMIGSAYRSASLQQLYFDNYVAASGLELANQYSAYPGESEHQTGLATDISTVSRQCYLEECFTSTEDGQWLASHAYTYGFILRYPKGKEAITGYQFEPWHYRYVGVELAGALQKSGLTLDEAWPYLQSALQTLKANGAI
ncbi:MAG: uncharacterized protein JWN33_684 [Candidatus Saccharibacteria bacterium]|nr:uncharacterized protein [Candidatus Saccharibacteria bacterium]